MSINRKDKNGNPIPTLKQRLFAQNYVKTKNGIQSAMKVYNTKIPNVANNIASENLHKPVVSNYIGKLLKEAEYSPINSIKSVMRIEEKASENKMTYGHSLKASEMLLKISSVLIDKSQHLSLSGSIDTMDNHDLIILKKKYDKLLED